MRRMFASIILVFAIVLINIAADLHIEITFAFIKELSKVFEPFDDLLHGDPSVPKPQGILKK